MEDAEGVSAIAHGEGMGKEHGKRMALYYRFADLAFCV